MKVKEVRALNIELEPKPMTPRRPDPPSPHRLKRPIDRYKLTGEKEHRISAMESKRPACIITAEDGTWGFGISHYGSAVTPLINDYFGPLLIGENCMATEKLWDIMTRAATSFTAPGLASYAISAIDCALWDLKGKLLQRPVYELLGGPVREKIFCYASGFDQEWYMELGFQATKLFAPYGPDDGLDGLHKLEELVAATRERIGDHVELMFDGWCAFDVEYTVRLAERLRPYRLKWIEELCPLTTWRAMRRCANGFPGRRWQPANIGAWRESLLTPLASGWSISCNPMYSGPAASRGSQNLPHRRGRGLSVIAHAGMNYPYGQHLRWPCLLSPGASVRRCLGAGCAAGRNGRTAGDGGDPEWLPCPQRCARLWSRN